MLNDKQNNMNLNTSQNQNTGTFFDPSILPDNAIFHFLQSAFLVKLNNRLLLFDYPEGNNGFIQPAQLEGSRLYSFSSHHHGDHYNSEILEWCRTIKDIRYILSSDIVVPESMLEQAPPERFSIIEAGQEMKIDDIRVKAYESSDCGVAFSVYADNIHIYFAGDNAFWNWDNNRTEEWYKQTFLQQIDGDVPMDIAFQVCDSRLINHGEGGIYPFAEMFQPRLLVPVHSFGDYSVNTVAEKELGRRGFQGKFWNIDRPGTCCNLSLSAE